MRIDKLLWFLRLSKTRNAAQDWIEQGHIRLNGRRIARSSAMVAMGDVLVLPMAAGVRVIALLTLPTRRGPASEAQGHYRIVDIANGPLVSHSGDETGQEALDERRA